MEDLDHKLRGAGEEDLGDVGVPAQVVHRRRVSRVGHQELETHVGVPAQVVHRSRVSRVGHQELETHVGVPAQVVHRSTEE